MGIAHSKCQDINYKLRAADVINSAIARLNFASAVEFPLKRKLSNWSRLWTCFPALAYIAIYRAVLCNPNSSRRSMHSRQSTENAGKPVTFTLVCDRVHLRQKFFNAPLGGVTRWTSNAGQTINGRFTVHCSDVNASAKHVALKWERRPACCSPPSSVREKFLIANGNGAKSYSCNFYNKPL